MWWIFSKLLFYFDPLSSPFYWASRSILLAKRAKINLLNLSQLCIRLSETICLSWFAFCCLSFFKLRLVSCNSATRSFCYTSGVFWLGEELPFFSGDFTSYLFSADGSFLKEIISPSLISSRELAWGMRAIEGMLLLDSTCLRLIYGRNSGIFLINFSCSNSI